jgi:hypothetical protein
MTPREARVSPQPVESDGVRIVVVGTVLWVVALGVLLVFHDRLSDNGRGWWIWVCVAGAGLGLIGIPYMRRYQSRVRRDSDHTEPS